jgi:hypothetical protein
MVIIYSHQATWFDLKQPSRCLRKCTEMLSGFQIHGLVLCDWYSTLERFVIIIIIIIIIISITIIKSSYIDIN